MPQRPKSQRDAFQVRNRSRSSSARMLPAPVFEKTKWAFIRSPALVRAVMLVALALLVRQFSSIESQPYIYLQY